MFHRTDRLSDLCDGRKAAASAGVSRKAESFPQGAFLRRATGFTAEEFSGIPQNRMYNLYVSALPSGPENSGENLREKIPAMLRCDSRMQIHRARRERQ